MQQIAFKDKAAAEAAKKAIAGGKSFADAAKEAGAKDSDIDLGLISKDRLIDPKIADAAFSLAKDTVSDPVEGRFATVLLRVSDIQPAVNRTFADVKDQVKDKLATKKAADATADAARPGRGPAFGGQVAEGHRHRDEAAVLRDPARPTAPTRSATASRRSSSPIRNAVARRPPSPAASASRTT